MRKRNTELVGVCVGVCLWVLLTGAGCAGKRGVVTGREFRERDSLMVERFDSLRMEHMWKSSAAVAVRWEEVEFSAPDSSGHQFVERVRQAVADSREVSVSRDTLLLLSRQEDRRLRETLATEQKESGWLMGRLPIWWALGVGGILLLGVWWCNRTYT